MFFKLLLTVLITRYIYASSDPVHISQNTITTKDKYINGSPEAGITVGAGAFWSLFIDETFQSNILSVQESAAFYLSNSKIAGSITFGGLINSNIVSISYPAVDEYYVPVNFWGEMKNNGNMFITNASAVNFDVNQWENTGTIVLATENPGGVLPVVGIRTSNTTQLMNEGIICLINQGYEMTSQLYGGGCIHLIGMSFVIFPQIDPAYQFDNTIVLHQQAIFFFTPCGATYTVAGFGGDKQISIGDYALQYEYDDQSGILSLISKNYVDYMIIGSGYNSTGFGIRNNGNIYYTGPVPNPIPEQCGVCPPAPIAPSP